MFVRSASYIVVALALAIAAGASAEDPPSADDLRELRDIVAEQRRLVDAQQQIIEQQNRRYETQQSEMQDLRLQLEDAIDYIAREGVSGAEHEPSTHLGVGFGANQGEAPRGYSVSLGANLNRQVFVAADGNRTRSYHGDSSNVPSFIYTKGRARINDDLTFLAHLEASLQANPVTSISQRNESPGFTINSRFYEMSIDSKRFGKLSFGKGFSSSFVQIEQDKSGTWLGNLGSIGNTAGGLLFYSKDTNSYSPLSVGDVFLDIEALSLQNRIRYDSPIWNGFRISGTVGENRRRDVTLRFNDQLGSFDVAAAGAYQNKPNGPFSEWRAEGSMSVLHRPTGLNLSGGFSSQKASENARKATGFIVRAGWRKRLTEMGEMKSAVDFARVRDVTDQGDVGMSAGAFLFQDVDFLGLQLYSGYRWYDLDRDDFNTDDIHVFSMGAAVQFDATWGDR